MGDWPSSDLPLPPGRAARLLRAKAGELESTVLDLARLHGGVDDNTALMADVALIATLLADEIERRRDS